MTDELKKAILEAWDFCDNTNKPDAFTFNYISEVTGMSYDDVIAYMLSDESEIDRGKYFAEKYCG